MKRLVRSIALLAMAMLAVPVAASPAQAAPNPNLIRNGWFSDPHVNDPGSFERLTTTNYREKQNGWRVERNDIDVFGTRLAQYGQSRQAANLTGSAPGILSQNVTGLEEGERYVVSWETSPDTWPGCERKPASEQGFSVSIPRVAGNNYTPFGQPGNYTTQSLEFTANDTEAELQIISQSSNNWADCGAMITNVQLRRAG
ncbi:DUF642 domain-containing protein [Streptomyces sp. RFCAC02]|uniref:DUF642 domain-containing protein n=1 Tax=Streptomyces sp. RFCAC02 TaxID=2499143 RepID=UPI00143D32D3|nr:DUF642 domain-containing protein [Streptomyces sp. RFCAC02]